MASKKRSVEDSLTNDNETAPCLKRRKLNDTDDQPASSSGPTLNIPLHTDSPSMSAATNVSARIKPLSQTAEITPPVHNTTVTDVNIDPNTNSKLWSFGDHSWVNSPKANTAVNGDVNGNSSVEVLPKQDSFSQFAGLGFQKVLDDDKKKKDDHANNTKTKTDTHSIFGGGKWADNLAEDGSFKLNFNWGTWKDAGTSIDLNPSSKIGWGSTAPVYDPNKIEENDHTKKVLEQMSGEQDAGDKSDEVVYSVRCKVYNLQDGQYIERGTGVLNVNTYVNEEKQLKGRLLCRREQTLNTIINAAILKQMEFAIVRNFIRFGVLEAVEEKEAEDKEKEAEDKEKEKEKEEAEEAKESDESSSSSNVAIKTYLLRPLDKSKLNVLLEKIKSIQDKIA